MRTLSFLMMLFAAVLLFSCTADNYPASTDNEQNLQDSAITTENELNEKEMARMTTDAQSVVATWNEGLNNKDMEVLKNLYGEDVNVYGQVFSNEEAVQQKKSYVERNKGFVQQVSEIHVEPRPANTFKASFVKKVTIGDKTQTYNSFMLLENVEGKLKIVAENDEEKQEATPDQPNQIKENSITSCSKAAEAIFLSAAEVQDMLKGKNVKYRVEYNPDSPDNPDHMYWFWVYSTVNGQSETYGRFQVDPKSGQLYKYDAVQDKSIPIKSDSRYKKQLEQYCSERG